jgi:hypothetical protein
MVRFAQDAVYAHDSIRAGIAERLGLDPQGDPEDSLMRSLASLYTATEDARKEWADVHGGLAISEVIPGNLALDDLIAGVVRSLEPAAVVKNARLAAPVSDGCAVLSFGDDVRTVIAELIAGGLSEASDGLPEPAVFNIAVSMLEEFVELSVSDNLKPLPGNVADFVQRGFAVPPDARFGRAWGLSVVQHTAMRGGGRLIVEPAEHGNLIRYLIPRAVNA